MGVGTAASEDPWWVVDALPDATVAVDQAGTIVVANARAAALFGWERDDLVGRPVEDLVPISRRADHRSHRAGYVQDPLARPMGAALELSGVRRDGSAFPAEISLGPLAGPGGDVLVLATVRDVTAQRRDQAHMRALLEAAPDSVIGLDGDGRVVLLNAQAERRFATPRSRVVGQPLAALLHATIQADDGSLVELVPAPDRARLVDAVQRTLAGDQASLTLRYHVTRPDGGVIVLEANGRAIPEVAGAAGGVLLISRNVSEDVRLQSALRDAKEEADRANTAKSQFVSQMSHELRTPLNAILGFGQLLEMSDLSEDDRESVDHVLLGGRHLVDLVDEVLDIARMESDELSLRPEPVLVAEVVGELVDLLAPLAQQRRVSVDERSVARCQVAVQADRQRLRQVLLNLMANAIKYNQPGGSVALEARATGDEMVRIEVIDTGWGIAVEDQDRLFQPFERLRAALTDVEGTGIGLALSKGLVEAMGGTIGVHSAVRVGSTFSVELPSAPTSPAEPGVPAGRARVLLVEDDPASVLLVRRVVQQVPGIRLDVAGLGEHALELSRRIAPDLVLLDLRLPDMPGEEVLAALRSRQATKDVPIVVMSGDDEEEQRTRLAERGASGTLPKPLDLDVLRQRLRQLLAPKG